MRILKVKGKNETIVSEQIKRQYGDDAVIVSKGYEEEGKFKWFKKSKFVITIAVKEESDEQPPVKEVVKTKEVVPVKQETESYEMLLSLKEQMSHMQEALSQLNQKEDGRVETGENTASTEDFELLEVLSEKLSNLGVRNALLKQLLQDIEPSDEVETAVTKLYNQIEALLGHEEVREELPKVVFFIGATGVGKTTTIAKLTAKKVLEEHKKVVLFTADTYRIAAIEQLKTYADILGVQIEVIYDESDIPELIEKWSHMDHIFIDTAGRSHKNLEQVTELKALLKQVSDKKAFLVMNANTSPKDVTKIIGTYELTDEKLELIVTKLDETDEIGNILNIAHFSNKPIRYITMGQNVPADIEYFNHEGYTAQLLGRINYE